MVLQSLQVAADLLTVVAEDFLEQVLEGLPLALRHRVVSLVGEGDVMKVMRGCKDSRDGVAASWWK